MDTSTSTLAIARTALESVATAIIARWRPANARTQPIVLTSDIAIPLVVDLDGTLLRGNVLFETFLAFLKQGLLGALQIPFWLLRGRATVKRELAARAPLSHETLPVNDQVLALVKRERSRGRRVLLATAADRTVASPIADRLGCFDDVLASDGRTNLKGLRKAEALVARCPDGFVYAGDSRADLPIWQRAREIVLVAAAPLTRRAATRLDKPTHTIATTSVLKALLACARLHQWAKNILVFAPGVLGGVISSGDVMTTTLLAFVALGLVSSSTYILNDLWDLDDDRRHWTKKDRPIASGALPISTAMVAAPIGLAAGFALAFAATPAAATVIAVYLAVTLGYTYRFKRVPILDVTVLAGLFTLRLVLGIVSADVYASPWLLTFSMFLFSSLCFAKRYVEIAAAAERGRMVLDHRGYRADDSPLLLGLGLTCGTASVVIMVLYIIFDAFQRSFYGNTVWLWAFPVVLFLWNARIWLKAARRELDDDPVAFALTDMTSIALGTIMVAAFILAWSGLFA